MKAAVLRGVGKPLSIEDIAISKPAAHEVLIRTKATGVCHSDLHFYDGSYPTAMPVILGHESAGVVEAVGAEVRTVRPGDHVITCLSAFCGHCEHCVTGHMSLCVNPETQRGKEAEPRLGTPEKPIGQFLNLSGFAEQMLVHEHACVAIDRDMPFDRAAIIGCAVLTGYGAVVHTSAVRAGDMVAVIGCGGVGLSAIASAALSGASRVIAIDRFAGKESLARHFGATDFVDASAGNLAEAVLELTGGGVHHAIEAVGTPVCAQDAFMMLRRGGAATLVGLIPVGQHISLHGVEFLAEKKIQGSFMGSNHFPIDIPRLIGFYMTGRLDLDSMISRRVGLGEIEGAFEEMKTGSIARSVIEFH